jgi:hypothetical protein
MVANREDVPANSSAEQSHAASNAASSVGADNEDSSQTTPLYESPRLKGYITLLSSSVYNYISAKDQTLTTGEPVDWCLAQYDLSLLTDDPRPNSARIRYAMTAAVITIMITCAIILIHFVSITGIGNKLWSKVSVFRLVFSLSNFLVEHLSKAVLFFCSDVWKEKQGGALHRIIPYLSLDYHSMDQYFYKVRTRSMCWM